MYNLMNAVIQSFIVKSYRKSCRIWLLSQLDVDVMLTLLYLSSALRDAQAVRKLEDS